MFLLSLSTIKKPITRQRSTGSANSRQRKKRMTKQISLPSGANQDQSAFYNQINLSMKSLVVFLIFILFDFFFV